MKKTLNSGNYFETWKGEIELILRIKIQLRT
jgi:hypothetical protein